MSEPQIVKATLPAELEDLRFDVALCRIFDDVPSRSFAAKLINAGLALLNDKKCKPSRNVTTGAEVSLDVSFLTELTEAPQAENIPLEIIYEDHDLLVIHKPAGLVVHPGAGVRTGTLVNAVLAHCGSTLPSLGGPVRAGIVHRLDRDTSGCMVVAKSQLALTKLAEQFANHTQERTYHALVYGTPITDFGSIETWHGRHPTQRLQYAVVAEGKGKKALLNFKVLKTFRDRDVALVQCELHTGRTHQIRVQMTSIGCPLLGDALYGAAPHRILNQKFFFSQLKKLVSRQMLHARTLAFIHPRTGLRMSFECELPSDMKEVLQFLEGQG